MEHAAFQQAERLEPVPVDDLVDLRLPVAPRVVGAHWRRGAEPVGARQPAVWGNVVAKQRVLLQVTEGSRFIKRTFVRTGSESEPLQKHSIRAQCRVFCLSISVHMWIM